MAELDTVAEGVEDASKVVIMPWTREDGAPLPEGKHVAITHWQATGEKAGTEWRQFCTEPAVDAILAFVDRPPYTDAHEPNGP